MKNSGFLMCVGLTDKENGWVKGALSGAPFRAVSARGSVELIHGDYFAFILRCDELDAAERNSLIDFFLLEDGGSSLKMFVGTGGEEMAETVGGLAYTQLRSLLKDLPELTKKAYEQTRRQESLTRSIHLSIALTRRIQETPGISTAQLADEFKKREVAVKRYIEELRMAGEEIVYDYSEGGWKYGAREKGIM